MSKKNIKMLVDIILYQMIRKNIRFKEEKGDKVHKKGGFSRAVNKAKNKVSLLDFAGILTKSESDNSTKLINDIRNLSRKRKIKL